jgi:hypothetical protein
VSRSIVAVCQLLVVTLAVAALATGCDDSGTKSPDVTSLPDADVTAPDADASTPDADVSTPDADASAPDADASTPDADAVTPDADAVTSDADAVTPDADAVTPDADAVTPDADAVTPDADAVTPDADAATPDASGPDEVPPVTGAELLPWLQAGNYTAWEKESAVHEGLGPHFGDVRVFLNPILAESLAAGDVTYPAGAAAVKELYGGAGASSPGGWAVWVKTEADSKGGDTLYWYEIFGASTYANSVGASLCTGCHSGGQDLLLTGYPLQ